MAGGHWFAKEADPGAGSFEGLVHACVDGVIGLDICKNCHRCAWAAGDFRDGEAKDCADGSIDACRKAEVAVCVTGELRLHCDKAASPDRAEDGELGIAISITVSEGNGDSAGQKRW